MTLKLWYLGAREECKYLCIYSGRLQRGALKLKDKVRALKELLYLERLVS